MAFNTTRIFDKMTSLLNWRSRRLLSLTETITNNSVENVTSVGLQSVPLSQIRGSTSSGRCKDFDVNFRPIANHSEERWAGVHLARTRGRKLPPVRLIQVGEIYFVEDGHHRISVAWALGDEEIDGQVTVWELGNGN